MTVPGGARTGQHELPMQVSSAALAQLIGLPHEGPARQIAAVASARMAGPNCLTFGRPPEGVAQGDAIWVSGDAPGAGATRLTSRDARLDFVRALHALRAMDNWPRDNPASIDPSARVHPSAVIETGATVGPNCVIGPHALIAAGASLVANVVVGAGSVIGHPGFGYVRQPSGVPLHFPHLGRILLAPGVVIGNQCSLSRGTLDDTAIGENVKIDDGSYIAHNVAIGANTLIMSGVRLNGRVSVGEACWIGTGAMVREGTAIGRAATVGMGAVVVKPVPDQTTVAGNPARPLE